MSCAQSNPKSRAERLRRHLTRLGVVLILALPGALRAQSPSLEREEPALLGLHNDTRSTLIADLTRSGGAYVLPPDTGLVTLESVTMTDSIQLCAEMFELQAQARALSARMAEVALDTGPLEAEVQLLQHQRRQADAQVAEFSDYRVLEDSVGELELDLIELELRREQLQSQFCYAGTCSADVRAELDQLTADIASLQTTLDELRVEAESREQSYRRAIEERKRLDDELAAREAAYFEQLAQIQALRAQVLDMYSVYARTAGARSELRYDSGWRAAIDTLASANPELWFEAIPTRAARVHMSLLVGVGTDAYLASNPAVLDIVVNGTAMPATAVTEPLPHYPEVVEASAVLSLASACVMLEPRVYDVELSADGNPLFALTVSYEYPTVSPDEVEVTYNLWRLRELVRTRLLGVSALEAAFEQAVRSGALAFVWLDAADPAAQLEHRHAFELRVFWQLVQQLWVLTAAPVYDPDSVRVYGGPYESSSGVAPVAALRELEVQSISDDARYSDTLAMVSIGDSILDGERSAGAVALGGPDTVLDVSEIPQEALEAPLLESELLELRRAPRLRAKAIAFRQLPADPGVGPIRPRPPVLPVDEGKKLRVEAISIPEKLTSEQERVIASGLRQARRAVDPTCGWYHLTCDGLTWTDRPGLTDETIRGAIDLDQTLRYSPNEVAYRTGATVFNP